MAVAALRVPASPQGSLSSLSALSAMSESASTDSSLSDPLLSQSALADSQAGGEAADFQQTVMERGVSDDGEGARQSMDRVWDNEDSEGGSTVVLSNRNNMDTYQRTAKPKPVNGDVVDAVKNEEEKESRSYQAALKRLAEKKRKFLIQQAELKAKQDEDNVKKNVAAAIKASRLYPGAFQVQKGKLLSESSKIEPSDHITYMFWVKPLAVVANWSSLLHKGDEQGDRSPAVFFYPGSFRLQVKSATATNWNDGPSSDPKEHLEAKKWSHVAFTHRMGMFKLYINGVVVAKNLQIDAPKNNLAALFAGSPYYDAADAELADVRYFTRVLTAKEVVRASLEKVAFGSSTSSSKGSASTSKSKSASSNSSSSSSSAQTQQ